MLMTEVSADTATLTRSVDYENRKLENYGFTPGQTSSMKRCRGFFFSCSLVASHARRRRKPSMSISSISFIRQPFFISSL